jgi:hypothetical protein
MENMNLDFFSRKNWIFKVYRVLGWKKVRKLELRGFSEDILYIFTFVRFLENFPEYFIIWRVFRNIQNNSTFERFNDDNNQNILTIVRFSGI